LIFLGSLAALLALSGTYEELYSLFVFAVWIFFALTAIALLRLRRKEPNLVRPYRSWGYPWTPLVFLAAALALTVNLWMVRPVRSSLGLVVTANTLELVRRPMPNFGMSQASYVVEQAFTVVCASGLGCDPSIAGLSQLGKHRTTGHIVCVTLATVRRKLE
jgi:amino acid transporter